MQGMTGTSMQGMTTTPVQPTPKDSKTSVLGGNPIELPYRVPSPGVSGGLRKPQLIQPTIQKAKLKTNATTAMTAFNGGGNGGANGGAAGNGNNAVANGPTVGNVPTNNGNGVNAN